MKTTVKMVKMTGDWRVKGALFSWICADVLQDYFSIPKGTREIDFVLSDKPMRESLLVSLKAKRPGHTLHRWATKEPARAHHITKELALDGGAEVWRAACKKLGIKPHKYIYVCVYHYYWKK